MNAQLAAPGAAPPLDRALLAVEGLSVRYRSERGVVSAVDDASFAVQRAEVLGLVGESGCGKSTVAGAILGLLPPSAEVRGSITYEGEELVAASPASPASWVSGATCCQRRRKRMKSWAVAGSTP